MSSNKTQDTMIARIVASYATRTDVTQNDIVELLSKLRQEFWTENATPSGAKIIADKIKPALPIDQAVTQEQVFCLCCGKGFKMLKRHLGVEHGLNESEYREMFDLPESIPLVAPSYSDRKAAHAKQLGLGKYHREASKRDEAYTE
jgi:predicted transcriptional regulator